MKVMIKIPVFGPFARKKIYSSLPWAVCIQELKAHNLLVVHSSSKTLPVKLKRADEVQGLTSSEGVIHILDHCLAEESQSVLLHEAFHASVQSLLGVERWSVIIAGLQMAFSKVADGSSHHKDIFAKSFSRITHVLKAGYIASESGIEIEEFGAYAVEEFAKSPSNFYKLVDGIIGSIKARTLLQLGIQIGKVTPGQLHELSLIALIGQLSRCSHKVARVSPAFSFAGVKAANADIPAQCLANKMESAGENAEAIRLTTGWYREKDQKWRFELSDHCARALVPGSYGEAVSKVKSIKTGPAVVKDILDHPRLFLAYPILSGIEVSVRSSKAQLGGGLVSGNTIEVSEHLAPEEWVSVILHELQHKIQEIEGFAEGCNPEEMRLKIEKLSLQAEYLDSHPQISVAENWIIKQEDVNMLFEKNLSEHDLRSALYEIQEQARERFRFYRTWCDLRSKLDEIGSYETGDGAYHRLLGEVEARNVQHRLRMNDKERKAYSPEATADVISDRIIVNIEGLSEEIAIDLSSKMFLNFKSPTLDARAAAESAVQYLVNEDRSDKNMISSRVLRK